MSEPESTDDPQASGGNGAPAPAAAPEGATAAAPADPPGDPAPVAALPVPTAEERLATLQGEKQEMRDRMLRIAADFENWKKRARKEIQEAEQRARDGVLREMLEVVDNLERATSAFAGTADAASVLRGVDLVVRLFHSKLERHEVKAIEAKGKPFDPRLHEAISQMPTADVAPGTVVNEMQKGYRVGDRLLRPAMVAVATAPAPAEEPKIEVAPEAEAAPSADAPESSADGGAGGGEGR